MLTPYQRQRSTKALYAIFLVMFGGMMAIAYFTGHAPHGFWPIVNGGEPAILYCWLFLYIAANGPGGWALDVKLRSWSARPRFSSS